LLPCEGLRLGVRIQTDLDKRAVTQRTVFGAKASAGPEQYKVSSPPNSRGADAYAAAGLEIKWLSVGKR
jgi:hypothetical protein